MMAALCTDGMLTLKDIQDECGKQKWVPLLTIKENDDPTPILPVFPNELMARSFARKNLPDSWLKGAFTIMDEHIKKMREIGWKIRIMDYPKKLKDLKHIKIEVEVFELDEEPEVEIRRGKR